MTRSEGCWVSCESPWTREGKRGRCKNRQQQHIFLHVCEKNFRFLALLAAAHQGAGSSSRVSSHSDNVAGSMPKAYSRSAALPQFDSSGKRSHDDSTYELRHGFEFRLQRSASSLNHETVRMFRSKFFELQDFVKVRQARLCFETRV